jgi:hypothetical protein
LEICQIRAQFSNELPSQHLDPTKNANAVTLRSVKELNGSQNKPLEEKDKLVVEQVPKPTHEPSVVAPKLGKSTPNQVQPPFPSGLAKNRKDEIEKDLLEIFKKVEINLSLLEEIR